MASPVWSVDKPLPIWSRVIEPAVCTTGLEFAVNEWSSIEQCEVGIACGVG
jgi:hypothetical protein